MNGSSSEVSGLSFFNCGDEAEAEVEEVEGGKGTLVL